MTNVEKTNETEKVDNNVPILKEMPPPPPFNQFHNGLMTETSPP